jgi:cation:H+ antiporter
MALRLVYLIISTAVLAKSADIVVENTSKLSRYFGISQVAAGLILLAVITSLPELSVAIVSGSAGEGAISAGNVFGSNIANIFLVLGAGAFLYGLKIPWSRINEIGIVLLLTTIISAYIIFSSQVYGTALDFPVGAVLLAIFIIYVYYLMKEKKKINDGKNNGKLDRKKALGAFLVFIGGIVVVFISSGFVVENAVITAKNFGVAESLIGATIIAVGTSLPELSTTLQAVRKKRYGIAVGNIIGSNMTNITLVLGTTAVLDAVEVKLPVFIAALLFAIVANAIILYFAAIRKHLGRYVGFVFIASYALFLILMLGLQTAA